VLKIPYDKSVQTYWQHLLPHLSVHLPGQCTFPVALLVTTAPEPPIWQVLSVGLIQKARLTATLPLHVHVLKACWQHIHHPVHPVHTHTHTFRQHSPHLQSDSSVITLTHWLTADSVCSLLSQLTVHSSGHNAHSFFNIHFSFTYVMSYIFHAGNHYADLLIKPTTAQLHLCTLYCIQM
jgi:hypothetical protein